MLEDENWEVQHRKLPTRDGCCVYSCEPSRRFTMRARSDNPDLDGPIY